LRDPLERAILASNRPWICLQNRPTGASMRHLRRRGRASLVPFVLLVLPLLASLTIAGARGASLTTVYRFCHGIDCPDGVLPVSGLVIDKRGDLLGTTPDLGSGFGTVFELIPNAKKTVYSEVTLHRFCLPKVTCPAMLSDGATPAAGLGIGPGGLLFGTTLDGGVNLGGSVFIMEPLTNGKFCCERVEYSFCSFGGTACTDGIHPAAGVIFDEAGNLYTTTQQDGKFGGGTVFEHRLRGPGPLDEVLYTFCSLRNCADGKTPLAGLVRDRAGNLYGTTMHGGAKLDSGTVFKVTPHAHRLPTETVIHNFCSLPPGCADGALPEAGLIIDTAGDLFGTTDSGGDHSSGTVFELIPIKSGTAYRLTVLHSFCSQTGCMDGAQPVAGLIMDAAGNLFGTTSLGGNPAVNGGAGFGTVFELVAHKQGTATEYTEEVLYRFCSQAKCSDGAQPEAGLVMDRDGNLYGTTRLGGHIGGGLTVQGGGTVFKLTP
jgi:uncharacterized repeat protein (TIGR03803 family)